jgi:Ca2+-binding RTX toxin-like protein
MRRSPAPVSATPSLLGNKGADYLLGGAGDDRITGGVGSDYLLGEKGADTFVFGPKSGMDLVADFDAGKDILDLSAYGFSGSVEDFLDAHTGNEGGCGDRHHGGDEDDDGVIIDLGDGNMLKLEGVSRWDLSADNVLL